MARPKYSCSRRTCGLYETEYKRHLSAIIYLVCAAVFQYGCSDTDTSPSSVPDDDSVSAVAWIDTANMEGCPGFCRSDGSSGSPSSLPEGFVAFSRKDQAGVFVQNLRQQTPKRVPNTKGDFAQWVCVSSNGRWIFYLDRATKQIMYIQPDGGHKGKVPTLHAEEGYPLIGGCWRNSPCGSELFYEANAQTLRAVKYIERGNSLEFVDDRLVLDITDEAKGYYIPGEQIALSGDQLIMQYRYNTESSTYKKTAHITIPQGGRGTASPDDAFVWSDEDVRPSGTCGYTMSFDGSYVVHNVGAFSRDTFCLPAHHKGFCLVPFLRSTTEPVASLDFVYEYGHSVNWCPPEFRDGIPPLRHDFYRWSFGNSNDYVVGRLSGENSDFLGIWLVEWATNTWTCITDPDNQVHADFVAVHFGLEIDISAFVPDTLADTASLTDPTLDLANPCYEVVYPNGGETLSIGDTCVCRFRSYREGNAVLFLTYEEFVFSLPGFTNSLNPQTDSTFTFVIPDSLPYDGINIPLADTDCQLLVKDYSGSYGDYSDSTFRILH